MASKKVKVGDYTVQIRYNEETNELDVEVLDEMGDIIESINIKDDEDMGESNNLGIDFNLN